MPIVGSNPTALTYEVTRHGKVHAMGLLLLVLTVICLVVGVFELINGAVLFGLILIFVGVFLGGNARSRL
jgi:uncharacterized membrane protein HdeD (DUF308 family)